MLLAFLITDFVVVLLAMLMLKKSDSFESEIILTVVLAALVAAVSSIQDTGLLVGSVVFLGVLMKFSDIGIAKSIGVVVLVRIVSFIASMVLGVGIAA